MFVSQKIAPRKNTQNDIFQKHKNKNSKLSTTMSRQYTHNKLTTRKVIAAFFKDVKIEESFSSQDQKLLEKPICDDSFFRTKNHHSANTLLQRSLTQ